MKTILLSLLFLFPSAHDFHVSLTEIRYNAGNSTLEVSIKIFTDDLIAALQKAGAPPLEIGTQNEPSQSNEYIERYLKAHFRLSVNGKPAEFSYLGKEAEADGTWCYLEIKNTHKVQSIQVENTVLLQLFDDQTNMINLYIGEQTKSGLSRAGKTLLNFEF